MRATRRVFNLVKGEARFELKNASNGQTASLYLYDEISPFGVTAGDFVSELSALGGQDFELHVNSPGGDVFDGLAILNSLRTYPGKVHAYVDGIAASAASFILCGATDVTMCKNSELMIHDAWGMCMGNASDMVDMADRLGKVSNNIANIYSGKAGGTDEEWRTRMKAEAWLDAHEAVEVGLADSVDGAQSDTDAIAFDLTKFGNRKKPEPTRESKPQQVNIAALLENAFGKVRA